MTKDYLSLRADTEIGEAAAYLSRKVLDSLPVVNDQNSPIGLINTETLLLSFTEGIRSDAPVSVIMSKDFETIRENEPLLNLYNYNNEVVFVLDDSGSLSGLAAKSVLKINTETDNYLQNDPFLKELFENIYCGILAIDAEKKVILCNSLLEQAIGISNSEIVGKKIYDLTDDSLLIKVLKTEQYEDGGKKAINGRTFASAGFPVFNDGGLITGAIALFRDISDKHYLAKELERIRELNKELDGIIDSSYDGIVVTDDKGKLLRINKSYTRISDISYENLQKCIGNYVGDLEKSRESYKRGTKANSLLVLANQKPTSFLKKLWKKKDLVYTGNPIYSDNGEISRIVWNIRDISELNTLKQEIKKSQYLTARYETELEELRARSLKTEGVIIHSQEMRKILEMAQRVANVDATVLITGETGVGKDVLARIIHNTSSRKNKPFISVNCGAIPENLLESELFGYESGAFTGAKRNGKIGLLETANEGTILLDEIGDLPMLLQVKILRVLQDQKIIRIGGTRPIKLNIRILAATNKELKRMVKENRFREDLFYRLNVIPITIPPLRNRKEDIIPLTRSFIDKYCARYNIKKGFSQDVFQIMENHPWPGNIRELENFVERALIICKDETISAQDISYYFESIENPGNAPIKVNNLIPLKEAKEILEMEILNKALSKGLSTRKTALILKVDHSTVVRKINKYKSRGNYGTVQKEKPSGDFQFFDS